MLINRLMFASSLAAAGLIFGSSLFAQAPTPPAASQPTTQPATGVGLRRPEQADILRDLLRQDRARPIPPQSTATTQPAERTPADRSKTPLAEGTMLVERPGRLIYEEGRPVFVFLDPETEAVALRNMPLLPNQMLETMEREQTAGFDEFVISAEITSYRNQNYLLIRKVLRRVGHGNLAP